MQKTEKALELVFLLHILHDFSRKTFLMLYSNNWPNFVFWLFFTSLDISQICFAIICFPEDDVVKFEIKLSFFTNLFYYMTKKIRKKVSKILRKQKKTETTSCWNYAQLHAGLVQLATQITKKRKYTVWFCHL